MGAGYCHPATNEIATKKSPRRRRRRRLGILLFRQAFVNLSRPNTNLSVLIDHHCVKPLMLLILLNTDHKFGECKL